ncbi:MAG: MFS transporter [Ilumatobacter sp.]|uniref:MFS transporter n=2 Tax=Ilumatobacter sp. TaxID=1967498 RepID=UPI001E01319F|nr:MFS transporter [Ilumatobacter sp.]MBT5276846.1 MFS transporter [Ilumatobacter sp.]MBT5554263.1 MFS transporter [Ilumatobacter sp.]MBT5864851.1 MFS transporter [Ilumatobacter sp.]
MNSDTDKHVPDPALSGDEEVLAPQPAVRGGMALWALFLGFGMLMVGNGLNLAVLGVRVVDEGFGVRTSGYVMSCYFAGFLIGPTIISRLLSTVGHIRVFAGLASLASGAVLIHSISVVPITWALMRLVFGFCMAGLFIVLESWLNDASTPTTRGRTLAVYMVVSMGGLAIGQLIIAFVDTAGYTLFILASVLVSLAIVPVTLAATTEAPPVREAEPLGLSELYRTVPTGLVGMLFTGMSIGVLFSLGAVYAAGVGFSPGRLAAFLVLPTVGSLLMQWPIGLISDRLPRRGVIFVVALGAVAVCGVMAVLPSGSPLILVGMFLLGGMTFPLYSLLLTYTLDWSAPGKAIGASSSLLRVNGAGAVIGPVIASSFMGSTGPTAFFWALAVTHGVIVAYVGYRIVSADALPMERQGKFVALPARSTELAIRLTARPLKASRAALRRKKPG